MSDIDASLKVEKDGFVVSKMSIDVPTKMLVTTEFLRGVLF